MPARTNKHQSKKVRKAQDTGSDKNVEKLVTLRDARLLCNALIEMGEGKLDRAMYMLQKINNETGTRREIVACAHCAKKIGINRCSGCPASSKIRYCSRECQTSAWPAHKPCCGVLEVIDVD